MKRKLLITGMVVLIVLLITNPTNNDFQGYIYGTTTDYKELAKFGRTQYFGIFSFFESNTRGYGEPVQHSRYMGIFKNFISLTP